MFDRIYITGNGSTAVACASLLAERDMACAFFDTGGFASSFTRSSILAKDIPYTPFSAEMAADIFPQGLKILVLSVNNMFLFPKSIAENPDIQIFNYHNSLLPAHRGVHAEAWAIYEGDAYTGITWHKVNSGVDTGDILIQAAIAIEQDTTSFSLLKEQSALAISCLARKLDSILHGNVVLSPQQANTYTKTHLAREVPGNGILEINQERDAIWRFLRAFDYGCVNVFPAPKISINNEWYTWRGYGRTGKNELPHTHQSNDCLVLPGTDIFLSGLHKI